MAFNWEVNGSNLGVLPLNTNGRQSKANMPLIYAHSDFVTDFQFSPFDDGLLATASQDLTVSDFSNLKKKSWNFFSLSYSSGLIVKNDISA